MALPVLLALYIFTCLCFSYPPPPPPPLLSLVARGAQNVALDPLLPRYPHPLFLFLWNKQYSLAVFDPLTMQGLHVWPVFLDQQVVAGKLLKGSSFFSLSAPHTQMGTCWTLPKVSAKLHILWILALLQAFERRHGIINGCKENNYRGAFIKPGDVSLYTLIFRERSVNGHASLWHVSFSVSFLPSTLCELKGCLQRVMLGEETLLAAVQLIVHQSGRGRRGGFDSPYRRHVTTVGTPPFGSSPRHVEIGLPLGLSSFVGEGWIRLESILLLNAAVCS